jgi:uncharacterized membrane protein
MAKKTVHDLTQKNIDLISRIEQAAARQRTVGERIADSFATMVGSWTFIIVQSVLLVVWMIINIKNPDAWDPYPFILLNLALSFQAAFATPIIMMSQNRQGRLADRRNQLDLQVNLLAEQESTEILRLLRVLCEQSGISFTSQRETMLEEATDPDKVIRQIDKSTGGKAKDQGASSPKKKDRPDQESKE